MIAVVQKTGATIVDLAWAAGLFEGEGCFTKTRKHPVAVLQMNDEDVVRRLHALLGVGTVNNTRNGKMWVWQAAGARQFQYVVALLWGWLHQRRRARAAKILAFFAAMPPKIKTKCKFGHDLTDKNNLYLRPGVFMKHGVQAHACLECRRRSNRECAARRRSKS